MEFHVLPLKVSRHTAGFVGFAIQVVVGAVAFVVVYLVAVAIAWIIHFFEHVIALPQWLSSSAQLVEMLIWGVDIFVFGLFMLTEVIKSVRNFLIDLKAD